MKTRLYSIVVFIMFSFTFGTNTYDSSWMKNNSLIKAPVEWSPKTFNRVSSLNDTYAHVYRPRKGGEVEPHEIVMSLYFFHKKEEFYKFRSKFWTYVFYPYLVIWHGSRLCYVDYFNYKYRGTGYYAGDPFSYLFYIDGEMEFRLSIIWFFLPFITVFYSLIILFLKRKLAGENTLDIGFSTLLD